MMNRSAVALCWSGLRKMHHLLVCWISITFDCYRYLFCCRWTPACCMVCLSVQDLRTGDPTTLLSEELYENGGPNDIAENGSPKAEVKFAENVDTEEVPKVLPPIAREDSPKSYASIVNASPISVHVPTTKAKPVFPKPEKVPLPSTTSARASKVTTSGSNSTSETNDSHKGGHSIFVRNLPLDATIAQLEEVFKKFGPIKPQGVQVRSHKLEHNCFGFVEFESLDPKQAAMEASPIIEFSLC
ncbi:uncharacterized protein LOC109848565 isoform X4 [Asparagus officinalis]|uniref:uncharacterized protein LOC109848565 isoform X4 n=1 Tax=Asparagus officinalis TaxID=4686 RepID=UPI00098DE36E|nr:uncharacterized protein LOC109848565 isoform X4 [Asparagus officinalis]